MIVAAALCPSPPLLVRALTGTELVLPELRLACEAAVSELLHAGPDLVVIVGAAADTRRWVADERLDLALFAPGQGGRAASSARRQQLPQAIGIGHYLLDEADYSGERLPQSVAYDEPAARCASLGAELAAVASRVALLVLGDGSARRGLKAPGYLDQRSAGFDAEVERLLRAGDVAGLLAIDPGLAKELMATGRPGWQVLAGALSAVKLATRIRYCDDPFGVAYLVASVRVLAPQ